MNRFFRPLYPLAILSIIITAACSPAGKQLMGDPQNPYPLQARPSVGEIVHMPTGKVVTFAQMVAVAGDARVVYVGENHDNPASHNLELRLLQGLAQRHPGRLVLGMEMFSRSQQPVLDRWVAGELDEKTFLKKSHWYDNWRMDFAYYRDLMNYARDRHIPIIALNAEKGLVKAVRDKPVEQLGEKEKKELPELDMTDPYQRAMIQGIFGDHGHGEMQLDGFVRAQTLWDETMAESVARFLAGPAGKDKHLMVVAGGYHVEYGFGIPRRAFRRIPDSYIIIGGREIDIPADKQKEMMNVNLPEFPMTPYDFLVFLAYESLPKTAITLGVMVEPGHNGHGLLVKGVVPGSNAERSGLKEGDLLESLDGQTLADNLDLIYAVRQKHAGDHGAVQVERNGRKMKLDVVFQAAGS
ncbi:MAG TPA: ChaN family lipoprotein [Geobacteraceae bacterium]|nr:ChaN family lipoprotein [Geobacteraceae bacterium]